MSAPKKTPHFLSFFLSFFLWKPATKKSHVVSSIKILLYIVLWRKAIWASSQNCIYLWLIIINWKETEIWIHQIWSSRLCRYLCFALLCFASCPHRNKNYKVGWWERGFMCCFVHFFSYPMMPLCLPWNCYPIWQQSMHQGMWIIIMLLTTSQ